MTTLSNSPFYPLALVALLPGPDRKRTEAAYRYLISYRSPQSNEIGCVMTWEVSGGRAVYQVALERSDAETLRLHCTCADAVFRAENEGRYCKHIHGLLQLGKSAPDATTYHPLPGA